MVKPVVVGRLQHRHCGLRRGLHVGAEAADLRDTGEQNSNFSRPDQWTTADGLRRSQVLSRSTPCASRARSLDAKHQRSQPAASGAKASPGARPNPASATKRLAVCTESGCLSSLKNAHMPQMGQICPVPEKSKLLNFSGTSRVR